MKSYSYLLALLLLHFIFSSKLSAQKKDSLSQFATIHGFIKDTAFNYYLPAATVAVYRSNDSSLLAYTLTNTIGEFKITGIPIGEPLQIKITFIGYKYVELIIKIPANQIVYNVGTVILNKSDNLLDDIVVTSSPVRMNGDTMEFNAAAFQLDKNAVAEDLLKNLPGVILWGDGTITVNGRQINKLLVDGKPFFNGEAKIATQNIPKNAISKVQVYQEYINPLNPFDSITTINLKLRKGYHAGYFGSLAVGVGTNNKKDILSTNNLFTPRDQLAIVAQNNNINKIGSGVISLLKNGTFKGRTAQVEYQPDFNIRGINQQSSAGYLYTHDFIPEYSSIKQNRLSSNSFANELSNNIIRSTKTISYVPNDSTLQQDSHDTARTKTKEAFALFTYSKKNETDSFSLKANFNYQSINLNNSARTATELGNRFLNNSYRNDSSNIVNKTTSITASFNHRGFRTTMTHKLLNWSANYNLLSESNKRTRFFKVNFIDASWSGNSKFYNRLYNNDGSTAKHSLYIQIGDFANWLFGESRVLSRYSILFENTLVYNIENQTNLINDIDRTTEKLSKNNYLSNISTYKTFTEKIGFKIGRVFPKYLANRYQKDLSVYFDAKIHLYNEDFASLHQFQKLQNRYTYFTPSLNISYGNFQFTEYFNRINFNIEITPTFPTPDLRIPLIDSSQIYNLKFGNKFLQPEKKYTASLRFTHSEYRTKNTLTYSIGLRAGITNNYIGDSIVIDQSGRYLIYAKNFPTYRFFYASAQLNKAFIIGPHQFQINLNSAFETGKVPSNFGNWNSTNSGRNISNITTLSDSFSLIYTFKDFLSINMAQAFTFYQSKQVGSLNGRFENKQLIFKLGAGLNLTNKLSANTNVNYNHFGMPTAMAINYTIWNASISYRFFETNNLLLQLSALDLLKQNKGLINSGDNLFLISQNVNLLQQYFMITLIYYPRKFGKK